MQNLGLMEICEKVLGKKVESFLSGKTVICVGVAANWPSGNIQLFVCNEGETDTVLVDHQTFNLDDPAVDHMKVVAPVVPVDQALELMGKQVMDQVTKVEGIITTVLVHMNGCVNVMIERDQTKMLPGVLVDTSLWVQVQRVVEIQPVVEAPATKSFAPSTSKGGGFNATGPQNPMGKRTKLFGR